MCSVKVQYCLSLLTYEVLLRFNSYCHGVQIVNPAHLSFRETASIIILLVSVAYSIMVGFRKPVHKTELYLLTRLHLGCYLNLSSRGKRTEVRLMSPIIIPVLLATPLTRHILYYLAELRRDLFCGDVQCLHSSGDCLSPH